jgi:RHS repeat-associated protein
VGSSTLSLLGAGFTPQTTVSLQTFSGSAPSLAPTQVQFIDSGHLNATFDLTQVDLTHVQFVNYHVGVADAGQTSTALGNFSVNTGGFPGYLSITILSPAHVKVGAAIGLTINIFNKGDSDAIAPLVDVQATGVIDSQKSMLSFAGAKDDLPGTVPPRIVVNAGAGYTPKPIVAGNVSTFAVSVINPSVTVVDWASQKAMLRPITIPADAWDAIWPNFLAGLGNYSMADFYKLLTDDNKALFNAGQATSNVARLTNFEIQKANNNPPLLAMASPVDLALPAPGLPLVFQRSFGQTIAGRYHLGRLGRGWIDGFDISASADSKGTVIIRQGGGLRLFVTFANQPGHFQPINPGDTGTLSLVNGAYQLREKNGLLTVFRTDGLLDYIQDTNNNRITAGYTGNQQTTLTQSNGSALTLSYNAQGRVSQVTDSTGRATTYSYDAAGEHLLSVTTAAGTVSYGYTADTSGPRAHAVASITNGDGTHRFFDYDTRGRLVQEQRDGGADKLTYVYDVAAFRVTDAQSHTATFFFDDFGSITRTLNPLGQVGTTVHDSQNHLKSAEAEGNPPATFGYDDKRGNLTSTVNPLGEHQDFTYDPALDRLASWRDALGNTTAYSHDANGNLLSTTYADSSSTGFSYNAQGEVVSSVNRRGQPISYSYDGRGLLLSKDLPNGTHFGYTYDAHGNLLSATDPHGTTTLSYDSADRLTEIDYPNARVLKYSYDTGGRLMQTVQDGFTVNYAYDAVGRLQSLTNGSGAAIVSYMYDSAGRLQRQDNGNGTYTTYDYDAAGQLLHLVNFAPGGTVDSRFDYTYDNLGRRTRMITLNGNTDYVYDAAGRLTAVTLPGGRNITYAYDAEGNRTTVTDNGATTTYQTNDLNQYTSIGGFNQAFDASGNQTSASGPSGPAGYAYDTEGRLLSVTTFGDTWTYEYDSLGHRSASTHNGVRTEYLVDPAGQVLGEYDSAGRIVANYTQGFGLTSRVDASGQAAYYSFDAMGNTAQLTGTGGAVLNSYSYLPFGEVNSSSVTVPNPFQHVGQAGVISEGNGLDFTRARLYSASDGRFITPDPIGLAGGTNSYAYGANNPISYSDPSGLYPVDPFGATNPLPMLPWQNPNYLADVAEQFAEEMAAHQEWFTANINASLQSTNNGQFGGGPNANPFANAVGSTGGITEEELADARLALDYTYVGGGAALRTGAGLGTVAAEGGLIGLGLSYAYIGIYAIEAGVYFRWKHEGLPCQSLLNGLDDGLCDGPTVTGGTPAGITSTVQFDGQPDDPNFISGPAGFGPNGFLQPDQTFPYYISFENKPQATAPAQQVFVTQQLDANLDWSTFQLGDFGFGDTKISVPAGRQFYSTRVDARAKFGVFVDVTAGINLATGLVTWTFDSLDPDTLDLPADPTIGFLPPDATAPQGEGFVTYTVRPKTSLASGSAINAKATIVFNTNSPLDTDPFLNTIDAGPPASSAQSLPPNSPYGFILSWPGQDDAGGSGISGYDVYVSTDGGPYALWLQNTALTSAPFLSDAGHSYAFYSVARDNVGHEEATPAMPDAQTTVVPGPLLVSGTSGNDNLVVTQDQTTVSVAINGGTPVTTPLFDITSLSLDSGGGTDSLTFAGPGGGPIGLVHLIGTFNLTTDANGRGIEAGGNSVVNFSTSQHLASLTLSGNAKANLAPNGNLVLNTGGLQVSGAGSLDLNDNDLIVRADAATRDAVLSAITGFIKTGRTNGAWDGVGGITSAAAANNSNHITGLAVVLNDKGDGTPLYPAVDGDAVDKNAVLVKYTYNGDADLSGRIDADDYFRIDRGFANRLIGYSNGDFDFNGIVQGGGIDADDYFLIDRAFAGQTAALSDGRSLLGAAVNVSPKQLSIVRTHRRAHHSRHHHRSAAAK